MLWRRGRQRDYQRQVQQPKRLSMLSLKGDPLEAISKLVPWEKFRDDIEAVVLTADEARKSNAGRKPIDALVLFRMFGLAVSVQLVG